MLSRRSSVSDVGAGNYGVPGIVTGGSDVILSLTSKEATAPRLVDPNRPPKAVFISELELHDDPGQSLSEQERRRQLLLRRLRPQTVYSVQQSIQLDVDLLASKIQGLAVNEASPPPYTRVQAQTPAARTPRPPTVLLKPDSDHLGILSRQLDDVAHAIPGTNEWIDSNDNYKSWLASQKAETNVLILIGDLATGKSVLAKTIIGQLVQRKIHAIPFVCKAEVAGRNSMFAAVASFVYLLLASCHSPAKYIVDRRLDRAATFTFREVWDFFLEIVADDQFHDYHFVVDALDQCIDQQAFQSALSESKTVVSAKMFFTSRPGPHTPVMESTHPSIQIRASDLANDAAEMLDTFLEIRGVSKMHSQQLAAAVKAEINEGVQGMLLILVAKMKIFDDARNKPGFQANRQYLRELFSRIPKSLEDYFTSLIKPKITTTAGDLEEMACIFNILLASQNDSFDEAEFRAALVLSRPNLEGQAAVEALEGALDPFFDAQQLCGSLVKVPGTTRKTGTPRRISIAHPAARSFLLKMGTSKSPDPTLAFLSKIELAAGHALLATACLTLLTLPETAPAYVSSYTESSFLPYCMKNWAIHVRESPEYIGTYQSLITAFLSPKSIGYAEWSDSARLSRKEFGTIQRWWEKPLPAGITIIQERLTALIKTAKPTSEPGQALVLDTLQVDFNQRGDLGRTPLSLALELERIDEAEKLLELGVAVQDTNVDSIRALHVAVSKGYENIVSVLLAKGATIDAEAMFISISQKPSILQTFLDQGASDFTRPRDGWSILHEAVFRDRLDMVKIIVERSLVQVHPNCKCHDGRTPLMIASRRTKDTRISKFLLEHHANPHDVTDEGSTALYEAAFHNNLDALDLLLSYNVEKNAGKRGLTPLMAASFMGFQPIAQRLISKRADIEHLSLEGDTALIIAVRKQQGDLVRLLLRKGAKTAAVNKAGQTALLIASSLGRVDIVAALKSSSKDFRADLRPNKDNWSCLHAAAYNGLLDNLKLLAPSRTPHINVDVVEVDQGHTPLLAALFRGHAGAAKHLLSLGADVTIASKFQWTALHMVCYYTKDEPLLRLILQKTPPEMLVAETDKGSTPLSLAAERGFAAAVKIMVTEYDLPTLIRNELGRTPLWYAANAGSDECVRLLLDADHVADIRDDFGWTALHAACRACPGKTVHALAELTNWSTRISPGLTPFHVALENDNDEAVLALLKAGLPADFASGWGTTPLLVAARKGNDRMVNRLLMENVRLDNFNCIDNIPISGAYNNQNGSLAKKVRPEDGFLPRLSSNYLESLIHGAARISPSEVEWCISQGMRPSSKDAWHRTPLLVACFEGRPDIVDFLLDQEDTWTQSTTCMLLTNWSPLHIASRMRHNKCIQILAQKSEVDPNHEDCFGLTAFDYAHGHLSTWLTLARSFPNYEHSIESSSIDLAQRNQVDAHQIRSICEWRQDRMNMIDNQLAESDAGLTALAMIDVFLRHKDDTNAQIAIDISLGRPQARLGSNIICHVCGRRRNERVFVCTSCPMRYLCMKCKEQSQREGIDGCSQHTFLEAPTPSWFQRPANEVDGDGLTESDWIGLVLQQYSLKISGPLEPSHLFSLNVGTNGSVAADIFPYTASPDYLPLLTEHYRDHPRDAALRDENGRTVAMELIDYAESDETCLEGLKVLVQSGVKLLSHDLKRISTVEQAYKRDYEGCVTFMLEQWSPDFDRTASDFSAFALRAILQKGWKSAAKYALERHYDWATRDDFKLRQLSLLGLDHELNVARLKGVANESSTATSTRSYEWPLVPFKCVVSSMTPNSLTHAPGCPHAEIPVASAPNQDFSELRPARQGDSSDHEVNPARFDLNVPEMPYSRFEESAEDYNVLDPRDDLLLQDVDHAHSFSDIDALENASLLCGLGGFFSDGLITPCFAEGPDDSGPLPGRRDGGARSPLKHKPRDCRDVHVSYSLPSRGTRSDPNRSFEVLLRAGAGLLNAIRVAQDAHFCCTSFTVAISTQEKTVEAHPVVALSSIPIGDVSTFVTRVRALLEVSTPAAWSSVLESVGSVLSGFGVSDWTPPENAFRPEEPQLDDCSLAMQLLCLGFASFLNRHVSVLPSPMTSHSMSDIHVFGCSDRCKMILAPVKMACVGEMIEEDILVFATPSHHQIRRSDTANDGAYLSATLEDILELWGPSVRFLEQNVNGTSTGRESFQLRQGSLIGTGTTDCGSRVAHWSLNSVGVQYGPSMSPQEKILLGALIPNPCPFSKDQAWGHFQGNLGDLCTADDHWRLAERSFAAGMSGPYVQATGQQNYHRIQGSTMKQSVVAQWSGQVGDLNVLNKPWGVIWSICTGLAERVPLRVAIAEVLFPFANAHTFHDPATWLTTETKGRTLQELRLRLSGFGYERDVGRGNAAFAQYLGRICRQTEFTYIRSLVAYILGILAYSGYHEPTNSFRVAWADVRNITACSDFSCARAEYHWLRMLKDTSRVAAFAVATERCLSAHTHHEGPYGPSSSCRLAHTQLQVPTPEQIPRPTEFHVLHTAVLREDENHRMLQLMEQQWYVIRLKDETKYMAKLSYLVTARGMLKFLLVFRVKDRLLRPVEAAKNALREQVYIQEQNQAVFEGLTTPVRQVLVSTHDDWVRQHEAAGNRAPRA